METNTIGRLYQAGRNTVKRRDFDTPGTSHRIENFITEMLAALVWSDFTPVVRVLEQAGLLAGDGITLVEPLTQQRVGVLGRQGIVDLVLLVRRAEVRSDEVWIEVKAGAGLHGQQLLNYVTAINDAADGAETPRRLVVIDFQTGSPRPGVASITWQAIHDSIRPPDGRLWRDFASFLVERGLAKEHESDPANRVDDEVVADVLDRVLIAGPGLPRWLVWSKGGNPYRRRSSLMTAIRGRSRQDGSQAIRLYADGQVTSVTVGVFGRESRSFGVQLTLTRWYPVPRSVLRRAVDQADLDTATWQVSSTADDDVIVAAYRPISGAEDVLEVAGWMVERLRELETQGLLVDLDGNGQPLRTVG